MNHKLHNTILALTVVGAVLVFGLIAASHAPAPEPRQAAGPSHRLHVPMRGLAADPGPAIEARARSFEADMARAGSASEMLALTSAFIAATVIEATVQSMPDRIDEVLYQEHRDEHAVSAEAPDPQESRRAGRRASLAMPYFSTAQGLRRGAGS